jgi:hypothetical protein
MMYLADGDRYLVFATELQGAERDDKYALQAERYPGFRRIRAQDVADHPGHRADAHREPDAPSVMACREFAKALQLSLTAAAFGLQQ